MQRILEGLLILEVTKVKIFPLQKQAKYPNQDFDARLLSGEFVTLWMLNLIEN